jgi:hypothetical protein
MPPRNAVAGEWKLHNEKLYVLDSSRNITWMIKSRRIRWVGHVAHMGDMKGTYRVLMGRPAERRSLGRPRRRGRIILKYICKRWDEESWAGLLWIRIWQLA